MPSRVRAPRPKKVSPIKTKIGKWEIVVEDDNRLPDDYIMLKYDRKEIYTFPTAGQGRVVFDGIDPYDDEPDVSKRDTVLDMRGNGFRFHTTSSGIVNLTSEQDHSTVYFFFVPVKVIQSLQALIRQKYGSSGNVEYNPSDQLVVAYGGAKRKRSSRKSRRRM